MGNEISEFLVHLSPDYQRGYLEGFERGKKIALTAMKEATQKIKDEKLFETFTGTTDVDEQAQ